MLNLPQRLEMMPNWIYTTSYHFSLLRAPARELSRSVHALASRVVGLGVTARFSALNAFVEPDRYRTLDCWPVEGTWK